jgi:hypothetical protein
MSNIPEEVRKKHMAVCNKCKDRLYFAKRFDMHFDWIDCWYDCENDYEHYLEEKEAKVNEN